jgi:hypothetical protein
VSVSHVYFSFNTISKDVPKREKQRKEREKTVKRYKRVQKERKIKELRRKTNR